MKIDVEYEPKPKPSKTGFFRNQKTGALIFAQPLSGDPGKVIIFTLFNGVNNPIPPQITVGFDHPDEWEGFTPLDVEASVLITP